MVEIAGGVTLETIGGKLRVRRSILLFCLLFAACCVGQSLAGQSSSATNTHPRHRAIPGGERSMRGCVAKDENGDYLLVPPRGVRVRLNSSDDISRHVGQQVKVSGAFVDADEPSTAPPAGGAAGSSQSGSKTHVVREFRVVKLDVISQTCSAPPARKK